MRKNNFRRTLLIMKLINVIDRGVIYENPLPQLKSRHGYFPSVQQLPDKSIIAAYVKGEAFESVDQTTVMARSFNGGKIWSHDSQIYNKSHGDFPLIDYLKITYVGGDKLVAIGYEYLRKDVSLPIGNPKTGGVLDDNVIFLKSENLGTDWSNPIIIKTSFKEPVEASAPLTVLKDDSWVTPIANFPNWEGVIEEGYHGRLLRTNDNGATWDDSTVTMEFPRRSVTIYEQRLCQLQDSGTIVVIAWNEDVRNGKRLANHYALSHDNGYTFEEPKSTGIMGQASSVMCIGKDRVLALHSIRRDTDRPGIYGYIVNLSRYDWDIEDGGILWEPDTPVSKNIRMAEIFSCLKFGQPSAIKLFDGTYMMVHWAIEGGQGKILWTKLAIADK
jgi:hypothetical protein